MWKGTVSFDINSNYNVSDTNRGNENTEYLKSELNYYGFNITLTKPIVVDRVRTDFPKVSYINDLRENVKAVVDGFYPVVAPDIIIDTARKQIFDYVEANKLELNLEAVNDMFESLKDSFKFSGTFVSGQDVIL